MRRVPRIPWNHMDMRVPHGLPAGLAAVRADVEPIGRMPGNEQFLHFEREQEAIRIFGLGQVEHGNHMPPGHDQRMPGGHGEGVRESERMGAFGEDLPVGSTEDAGWLVHAGWVTRPGASNHRQAATCS